MLAEARDYLRALRARNAALRQAAPEVEESFRTPLAKAGARLLLRRRSLLAELSPRFKDAFQEISGPQSPQARLDYRPVGNLDLSGNEAEVANRLAELLEARLERNRERGFTSAGPHADDATLAIDGRGARFYGSQGQQRALVLALKIGEIENLRATHSRPPLLLLDDVSSELDPAKNGFLLSYLRSLPGQAFLTSTDPRLLATAAGPESAFFQVEGGVVSPLSS